MKLGSEPLTEIQNNFAQMFFITPGFKIYSEEKV